ncbi:response regulator transcription factor [Anaerovorax odorimutans]|uniref:response regulator transcription factor n=1 Tax=Anaerovorax odorimutans TaxID=109327 RepID=UPI00042432BA|nr:helix-turn-helix transcriptional regulator [Anaerovorax odorimutans]
MQYKDVCKLDFLLEMSERQISAREFFSNVLLNSLDKNLDLKNVLILCFDKYNNFLSWTDRNGILINCEEHPYRKFAVNDVIGHMAYQDACRDHLTYFNVVPRLYKSTDIIDSIDYDNSAYVRFMEENFHEHYSVTMALGINAYIQIIFFKSLEEGDFTDEEMEELNKIYIYMANSYKNFKKHEQAKIISNIQNEIISSGEKAYLITDDFNHIMSYNKTALSYLEDILGSSIDDQMSNTKPCAWLPFLLGGGDDILATNRVQTSIIKNYIFKIYTYDQCYSHGIIDRYHWITISKNEEGKTPDNIGTILHLTQSEWKVAELLYDGLTYQAIADELVLSYHTVKNHVQNIYTKCGVKSRFQLCKLLKNIER